MSSWKFLLLHLPITLPVFFLLLMTCSNLKSLRSIVYKVPDQWSKWTKLQQHRIFFFLPGKMWRVYWGLGLLHCFFWDPRWLAVVPEAEWKAPSAFCTQPLRGSSFSILFYEKAIYLIDSRSQFVFCHETGLLFLKSRTSFDTIKSQIKSKTKKHEGMKGGFILWMISCNVWLLEL